MPDFIRWIMGILTVFRLSEMLVLDDGFLDVFAIIRGRIENSTSSSSIIRSINDGLHCCHCVGVWVSILVTPCILFPNPITDAIIAILGVAGIQSILINKVGRES